VLDIAVAVQTLKSADCSDAETTSMMHNDTSAADTAVNARNGRTFTCQ